MPIELWSQTQVVKRELFPNWKQFAERYCDGKTVNYKPFPRYECKGAENLTELHTLLRRTIMIRFERLNRVCCSLFALFRRSKKDVLHDLPDKLRKVVYLAGNRIEKGLKELRKAREALTQAEEGSASFFFAFTKLFRLATLI